METQGGAGDKHIHAKQLWSSSNAGVTPQLVCKSQGYPSSEFGAILSRMRKEASWKSAPHSPFSIFAKAFFYSTRPKLLIPPPSPPFGKYLCISKNHTSFQLFWGMPSENLESHVFDGLMKSDRLGSTGKSFYFLIPAGKTTHGTNEGQWAKPCFE